MFCKNCGNQLADGMKFCNHCGTKVPQTVPAPQKAPTVCLENNKAAPVQAPQNAPASHKPSVKSEEVCRIDNEIKTIWPDWEITEKIGQGSFGSVFKAQRKEYGTTLYSAIKIIRIPKDDSETAVVQHEIGLDDASTTSYFKGVVDECVNEIQLMVSLKGNQNVVSVEDYKVVQNTEKIGWTIYLRMELLTSFNEYMKDRVLTEPEIIQVGIDICNALEFCHKMNILHRDIKLDNIFISSAGTYKLGDFGIARKLEKATAGLSQKGTYNYMAPEIYHGNKEYDFRSDIYSLGIVLYRLSNNNRLPLLSSSAKIVTAKQMQSALDARMKKAALPAPCNASPAFADVILYACAYDPAARFANASVMKNALIAVLNGNAVPAAPAAAPGIFAQERSAEFNSETIPSDGTAVYEKTSAIDNFKNSAFGKTVVKAIDSVKSMSKTKKIIISSAAGFVFVALIGLIIFLSWYNSLEQKILRALEDGNYESAIELFNEEYSARDEKDIADILSDRLDSLKSDFRNDKIEYSDAQIELSAINQMSVSLVEGKIDETEVYIERLNDSKTAFRTAQLFIEQGDYANAITQYRLVIEEDPNYETAKTDLSSAIDSYRTQVLADASELSKKEEYAKAITTLQSALNILPNDPALTEQLTVYSAANVTKLKNDALNTATEFAADKDYESAINTISAAMVGENADDSDLKMAYDNYCDDYVDFALAKATTLISNGENDSALELLNSVDNLVPNNASIQAKIASITPLCMTDEVPAYQSGGNPYTEYSSVKSGNSKHFSMAGIKYYNGMTFSGDYNIFDDVSWAVYNLDKKYSRIEFTVCHVDGTYLGDKNTLQIIYDGFVTEEIELAPDMAPKYITLDVSGVTQLKLQIGASGNDHPIYGLGNPVIFSAEIPASD